MFGILLTVSLVPIFNYTKEEGYSSLYLSLDLLNQQSTSSSVSDAVLNETIASVLAIEDFGADIYFLEVDGTVYLDEEEAVGSGLRSTERYEFAENVTTIKLDISATTRTTHGMSIGMTSMIVLLFAGLAFTISRQISKLVVRPIEKMTQIVQEFTKNICLLGGTLDNQHRIVTELLETDVIEAAITTLGSIFSSLLNPHGASKPRKGSLSMISIKEDADALSLSADSLAESDVVSPLPTSMHKKMGTTLLTSRDSVLEIQIKQSTRIAIEDEEIFARIRQFEKSGDIDSFYIRKTRGHVPEFTSLTTVMEHPIASEYFRVYCTSHMIGESFFFVKAVNEYRDALKGAFSKVYAAFIDEGASKKVSITQKDRSKLDELFKENRFGIRVFDGMRREIVASLSAEAFNNFEQSKFAVAYLKSREQDKQRYSHIFKK